MAAPPPPAIRELIDTQLEFSAQLRKHTLSSGLLKTPSAVKNLNTLATAFIAKYNAAPLLFDFYQENPHLFQLFATSLAAAEAIIWLVRAPTALERQYD